MKFNYHLTKQVSNFIENCELEEIGIGCSNSQVVKILKENKIYYLKVADKGLLTSEYEKLMWLSGKLPVPKIAFYEITDDTEYLITESVLGEMLCSEYYRSHPEEGIKVVADAFRQLSSVSIKGCPFDNTMDHRLSVAARNVKNGLIHEKNVTPEVLEKYGSLDNMLLYLKERQFEEELCFSFGDISLPNVFGLKDKCVGFIDVGECGISDKWFDLAICEKSIKRNYGKEYVAKFYEELNITPNPDKVNYYLLLMELYI